MRSDRSEPPHSDSACPQETLCARVEELLPWIANGSLSPAEQEPLDRHLADCDACRGRLGDTVGVARLWSQHLPVEVLIEHALGEPLSALEPELVEDHLAHCASCRAELEIVAADLGEETADVVPFASFDRRRDAQRSPALPETAQRHRSRRRRGLEWLAAVACLALAVVWTVPVGDHASQVPTTIAQPTETQASPGELISSLEFTIAGPVELLPGGRAVLDGVFLDGFESVESSNWSIVIDGEERTVPTDSRITKETKPILSTNEET